MRLFVRQSGSDGGGGFDFLYCRRLQRETGAKRRNGSRPGSSDSSTTSGSNSKVNLVHVLERRRDSFT